MVRKTHLIECPYCNATMEVEAMTGKVVGKWERRDKSLPPEERFREALSREKESKEKLGEYFKDAQSLMEEKKKKAQDIFQKGLRKLKEE